MASLYVYYSLACPLFFPPRSCTSCCPMSSVDPSRPPRRRGNFCFSTRPAMPSSFASSPPVVGVTPSWTRGSLHGSHASTALSGEEDLSRPKVAAWTSAAVAGARAGHPTLDLEGSQYASFFRPPPAYGHRQRLAG